MFILTLIGLLLASAALYGFIEWFNAYTQEKARYQFFSIGNSVAMVFAYGMLYFGNTHMQRALENNGDWLNGALVMVIGISILIGVVVNNFKNTPRKLAIQGTIAQIILYVPIAVCAVIIVIAVVAFFSQIRPVYSINSRD